MGALDYGLEGKVAVITGAASGIGRATAELFSAQGAVVIASDVDAQAGAETVERIRQAGGSALFFAADVTDAVVQLLDDRITVGRAEVAAPADPEVLTVEQAAALLQVDADTVRALAREGDLPGRKVGREWRFSRAAVLAWLGGDR